MNDDRNVPIEQYTFNSKDWGDDMILDTDSRIWLTPTRRTDCDYLYPHSIDNPRNVCFACEGITASEFSKKQGEASVKAMENIARQTLLGAYRPGDKPLTIREWFQAWFGWK